MDELGLVLALLKGQPSMSSQTPRNTNDHEKLCGLIRHSKVLPGEDLTNRSVYSSSSSSSTSEIVVVWQIVTVE